MRLPIRGKRRGLSNSPAMAIVRGSETLPVSQAHDARARVLPRRPRQRMPTPRHRFAARDKIDRDRRIIDRVVLDADERHRRRMVLERRAAAPGSCSICRTRPRCATATASCSRTAPIVRVAGKREALVEIAAASAQELARLAWHIGNRHTDVQVVGDRLRIRRDACWKRCCAGSALLSPLSRPPFEPEPGAYEHDQHEHDRSSIMRSGERAPHTPARLRRITAKRLQSAALYRLMTWLSPGVSHRRVLLFERHRMGGRERRHPRCHNAARLAHRGDRAKAADSATPCSSFTLIAPLPRWRRPRAAPHRRACACLGAVEGAVSGDDRARSRVSSDVTRAAWPAPRLIVSPRLPKATLRFR